MNLKVLLEPSDEGGYTAIVPSLPGCISEGDTLKEARENIADAIKLYVECMIADGEEVPTDTGAIFTGKVEVNINTPTAMI